MGPARVSAAVVDAGPLIHLPEIGCVALLGIFETLHIPETVLSEAERRGLSQADLSVMANVQRTTCSQAEVARFTQQNDLVNLHVGERECLYLCRRVAVPILLTDDLASRGAAKRLNLTPVGSLGVVVRAYRLGRSSLVEAERHIVSLHDSSSLFVTRAIVDLALDQLRQLATEP